MNWVEQRPDRHWREVLPTAQSYAAEEDDPEHQPKGPGNQHQVERGTENRVRPFAKSPDADRQVREIGLDKTETVSPKVSIQKLACCREGGTPLFLQFDVHLPLRELIREGQNVSHCH